MFALLTRRGHRVRRLVGAAAAAITLSATLFALDDATAQEHPDAVASPGCAQPAPSEGQSTLPFADTDREGTYIQDIPPGAHRPLPVILNLHGFLEPAYIQHEGTGFAALGATAGFVTITPQLSHRPIPYWDFGEHSPDITYLSNLLTHVENTVCVDTRRIYASGLSMGGFTSSALACRLSDRIAAIAPVAGIQDFPWCTTTRPVPVITFHGDADPIVAYTGGTGPNAQYLPVPGRSGSAHIDAQPTVQGPNSRSAPENTVAWAQRNGCAAEPAERSIAPDATVHDYTCPADASVQLYTLYGVGHIWPGTTSMVYPEPLVGRNTNSVNATALIWDFFRAHPLRG